MEINNYKTLAISLSGKILYLKLTEISTLKDTLLMVHYVSTIRYTIDELLENDVKNQIV